MTGYATPFSPARATTGRHGRTLRFDAFDYITALKALKIQYFEGLKHPLIGALDDVKYRIASIPIDKIDAPPALKKRKPKRVTS